ncbi:uncharacterized protein LOC122384191 [Amphibalanus amphitrite]|uniref:uncharacterized protein LOC122384191 n=1 Tax=Amphibalanus amphitrite TaxID=1232801 RepID=UPI001C915FA3|nr:uncharacterized protein LOC122384191 [Amphibalanus amphitrite]
MEKEPFLPFEDISLEGLSQPLKGRTRIQYTCFTVSNQFIMIGTNTGGVYVFNRKSRQFVSILPGQAGAVTCLAIDPGEQLVAAGSVQGGVSVYACPTARSWSGQLTALARLDSEVRAICWRHAHWSGRLLYVGTAAGKVLSLSVSRRKSPAASATITPMLQLDSAVSELVLCGQTLLVSTLGFCYLCNVQMEVFAQVGTQPRSGRLGACFLGETVFCARPGLRLWEVRLSGQVSSTHQLKPALDEATARRVVSACDQPACLQDGGSGGGKSALGLLKLVPLSGGAVAGFSGDALFVFELAARRVLLWTSVHAKVRDLAAVGDELYVQCEGGALRRLLVRRPSQIVRELRASRGAGECARFLMSHTELTDLCRTQLPLQVLREAVRQFADDEAMQVELKRLAAVLRDRLSEDGVAVEAESPAPTRRRSSATTSSESERTPRQATTPLTNGRTEKKSVHKRAAAETAKKPQKKPAETREESKSVTEAKKDDEMKKPTAEPASEAAEKEKKQPAPENDCPVTGAERPGTDEERPVTNAVLADGCLEELPVAPVPKPDAAPVPESPAELVSKPFTDAVPESPAAPNLKEPSAVPVQEPPAAPAPNRASPEPKLPNVTAPQPPVSPMPEPPRAPKPQAAPAPKPPVASAPQPPSNPADDAIVFRSSRKRRVRPRPRLADRPTSASPESRPPDPPAAAVTEPPSPASEQLPQRQPAPSTSPPLPPPPPPPMPTPPPPPLTAPMEWHDSPSDDSPRRGAPAAAAQLGAYGYTPGLALHPEVLDAFSDLVEDVKGAVSSGAQRLVQRWRRQASWPVGDSNAPDRTPERLEQREPSQDVGSPTRVECLNVSGATSGDRRDVDSASLGNSPTVSPTETALSELAAAAATLSDRPSLPQVLRWVDSLAAVHRRLQKSSPETVSDRETYPALRQLCAEPHQFVCNGVLPGPTALRDKVSRGLGSALLFLASDEQVCDELVDCVTVTDSADASEQNGDGAVASSGRSEEGAKDTAALATSVESNGSRPSDLGELGSGNESMESPSAISEFCRSIEASTDTDSGVQFSEETLYSAQMADCQDGDIEHNGDITDKLAAIHLDNETEGSCVERSVTSCEEEGENPSVVEELKDAQSAVSPTPCDPEPSELSSISDEPVAGSPAWLAGLLTLRLFYLVPGAELRAGLGALPASARARLWRLLLSGTEARLGPFAARPGDAALAMELTAGAELDWLTLARLGAGLCRASPSAAAAFCVQQSDRLSALDVLYICRYAVAPGRVAAAFTAYLTAAGGSVATAVLADAELSAAAESALTAVWRQQAVGLRCQCGWPRPGAHRAPRPAAALLRRLCAARLSGQQLSEELWTLGDWTGWLQTGGDSSDRRPLAAVLCQLDDCALLQTAGPHLPSWRPVLTALAAARPDHCHSCGDPLQSVDAAEGDRRPLTVQTLLAFVTSQEGPAAAVRLLQTAAEVAPCQLTASCYRDVILSTMLNRRAPGLGRAFGAETLGLRPTPVPEDALEVLFSELGRPAPPPLPEVPAAGGCTLVSLTSDCPACCLPLRNRHLLQPHGVLTFRCGHAFHAVCLLRRDAGSCLLCRR